MRENFLKLANAAYKVIEFFPESDPLKNRAKDRVLAIMSALGGSPEGGENSIQEDIDILLGYFWLAKCQGWLNSANYLIICAEYKNIKSQTSQIQQKPNGSTAVEPLKIAGTKDVLAARQLKILDFLENNQKAQVMDLQKILPDVTKRTIRRDLDELLESGEIIREGEFNEVFYRLGQGRT